MFIWNLLSKGISIDKSLCMQTYRKIHVFFCCHMPKLYIIRSKHLLITQPSCEQQRTGGSQPQATNSSHSALVFDQPSLIKLHQVTRLFLEPTSTRALNCAETWMWCRLLTDSVAIVQIAHSVLNAWLCKYLQLEPDKVVLHVFFFSFVCCAVVCEFVCVTAGCGWGRDPLSLFLSAARSL